MNNSVVNKNSVLMDLGEFLEYFDFSYDIVSPDSEIEYKLRNQLIEEGDLSETDLDKDLICFIDLQNAYLGGIDKERYPISNESIPKIIERLDVYINDSVISEFDEALNARGIDTDTMDLAAMSAKCEDLGVGDGEVSYVLAKVITSPESIYIKELEKELEFVFEDEILVCDNTNYINGYVCAYEPLVNRLMKQEHIIDADSMDNINFYPVYNPRTKEISMEGSYYLMTNDNEIFTGFELCLRPDEKERLIKEFEGYCAERYDMACSELLQDILSITKSISLDEQIKAAEGQKAVVSKDNTPDKEREL